MIQRRDIEMQFLLVVVFSIFTNTADMLGFARALEKEGDYYRAVLEYKRVFYNLENSMERDSIVYRIVKLYEKLNDLEDAEKYLEKVRNKNTQRYAFEKGLLYFLWGRYSLARNYWMFSDTLVAWTYLKEGKIYRAENVIGPLVYPTKSPLLAALFSTFIPGAGKIYAGRASDGLYSMLVNGVLGYLVYNSYKHGRKISFYLYSTAFLFMYTGNVYGSYLAAKQFNDYNLRLAISEKELKLGLWRYLP